MSRAWIAAIALLTGCGEVSPTTPQETPYSAPAPQFAPPPPPTFDAAPPLAPSAAYKALNRRAARVCGQDESCRLTTLGRLVYGDGAMQREFNCSDGYPDDPPPGFSACMGFAQ